MSKKVERPNQHIMADDFRISELVTLAPGFASSRKRYNFLCVIQKYTKFANFAGLYFSHFTTFRDQTLQFY